jgi:outer membrane protein OmpA-like peptidoglycan-associated protein
VWCMTRSMVPFAGAIPSTVKYLMNFGDAADTDLSTPGVGLGRYVSGYSELLADVFIHEMTHIWQYSRPYANAGEIALRCVYAQEVGAGYHFTPGKPWASYNLEQQGNIVEKWNSRGRKEDDELFPYIHYLVRKEGQYKNENLNGDTHLMGLVYTDYWFANHAGLDELKALLMIEREPVSPIPEPVRVSANDRSFVVILNGDVLFDFAKYNLKPASNAALEQAWNKVKANPRRRFVYINGHTDSIGNNAYNERLSEKRAEAVAQWFYQRGYLTPAVVRTQGFGESQPVASNKTAEGRAQNRRVEINLTNG